MSPDPGDETKFNRDLKAQPQSGLVNGLLNEVGLFPKKVEDQ